MRTELQSRVTDLTEQLDTLNKEIQLRKYNCRQSQG